MWMKVKNEEEECKEGIALNTFLALPFMPQGVWEITFIGK